MSDLDDLRRLLFGQEQDSLNELRRRVETPGVRARDVAEVLPESIRLRGDDGGALLESLQAPVDECIRQSIRRDPDSFADVLFPVMGPAIRKAVLELFRSLTQRLNQTIEHALSWRGVRWRWEAWRTGLPIGDVILRHTLVYGVDQIFAIHAVSGRLLQHVARADPVMRDTDAVSAMLTAIQDFVRDSFGDSGQSDLDTIDIGDRTVWILYGPDVMLAVAFRGVPPRSLRDEFRDLLDEIHVKHGEELAAFDGEANTLAGARPRMEACLFEQTVDHEHGAERRGRLSPQLIAVLLLLALGTGTLVVSNLLERHRARALAEALAREPGIVVTKIARDDGRIAVEGLRDPVARAPEAVAGELGLSDDDVEFAFAPFQSLDEALVLKRARHLLEPPATVELALRGTTLIVSGSAPAAWMEKLGSVPAAAGVEQLDASGLRADPTSILARIREQIGAPDTVEMSLDGNTVRLRGTAAWSWIETMKADPFSIDDRYVLDFAALAPSVEHLLALLRELLEPPATVTLRLEGGTLFVAGTAPQAWIERLATATADLPAVARVDRSDLRADERLELDRIAAAVDGTRFSFESGIELTPESERALTDTARALKRITSLAGATGADLAVDVTGHTDATGQQALNQRLRRQRAESVVARLAAAGVDRRRLRARAADGAGAGETPDFRYAEIRITITQRPHR